MSDDCSYIINGSSRIGTKGVGRKISRGNQ